MISFVLRLIVTFQSVNRAFRLILMLNYDLPQVHDHARVRILLGGLVIARRCWITLSFIND